MRMTTSEGAGHNDRAQRSTKEAALAGQPACGTIHYVNVTDKGLLRVFRGFTSEGGASMAIGITQKSYPFNYNTIVSFVPRQPGVYVLFNANWFYVGESDDLADGLLQVLIGETAINGEQPSTFQFEVVPGDEKRKVRMNQLSRNFQASESK
jgi:hypothetical protein